MNAWINVARYHLANRVTYLLVPWLWLAFAFAVDLIIFAVIPMSHHGVRTAHGIVMVQSTSGRYAGGMGAVVALFFVLGLQSVARSLPFALALAATLVITWSHTWAGTGHFFTELSAAGLTGLLAALSVALLAGGYVTIRRVTV